MKDLKEEWRDVPGYEGLYKVSNLGRVYSVRRRISPGRFSGGYYLSIRHHGNGYCFVGLSKGGECRQYRVHRLVASAFIPNEAGLPEVNHIDGDKDNNAAANLEWCTRAENNAHAVHKGLRDLLPMQQKASLSNRRPVRFLLDGSEVGRFPSIRYASLVSGIAPSSISAAVVGKTASCDGYRVEYV